MTYTLVTKRYKKVDGEWILQTTDNEPYNLDRWHKYILGSRSFFNALGGIERLEGNTLTSISPDGNDKTVYRLKRGV